MSDRTERIMKIQLKVNVPVADHVFRVGDIFEVVGTYRKQPKDRGDHDGFWIRHTDKFGKEEKVKIWDYECEVIG